MKKLLSISIVLVLILSLVACGNVEEKIEEELEGAWTDRNFGSEYIFENGKYFPSAIIGGVKVPGLEGTYKIDFEKEVIIVTFEKGNQIEFEFDYEDGELSLFYDSMDLIKKY